MIVKQKLFFTFLIGLLGSISLIAQSENLVGLDSIAYDPDSVREEIIEIDGQIVTAVITGKDTIILARFDDVRITDFRSFNSNYDYMRYKRLRQHAIVVYPYAVEAIKIFKEVEHLTQTMKKRKRKKHIKKLQKRLKTEFEDPLKSLTKNQGKLMVKMIERELDSNMFDLLKGLRGRFTAMYWNQFSKLYGYKLKQGWEEGKDPILDAVLQDFDISYEIE